MKTLKQDDAVMKCLGVSTVRRLVCNTDKGLLELMIRKGDTRYFLTLDSVPLEADLNKDLMGILFPVKEEQVPQVNKGTTLKITPVSKEEINLIVKDIEKTIKNKGGRPKKANGQKVK